MDYVYIYDIATGKIMAISPAASNYKKMQDNITVPTDIIISKKNIGTQQLFNYRVNLQTLELERIPFE